MHTKLSLKMLRDYPGEQVIWNQDRPIAYLNCADASVEEFTALERLIVQAPATLKALELAYRELDARMLANNPVLIAVQEAIRKARGE